jgi:hypothetical protein
MNKINEKHNHFLKKLTEFGKIKKLEGIKINGDIKMEPNIYQNDGYITLILFHEQKKNSSYPFLCNL